MYIKNLFLSIQGQKPRAEQELGTVSKQEREEEGERGTDILYIAADSGGQGREVKLSDRVSG